MVHELTQLHTEVTQALQGLGSRETQLTPQKNPEKWSIQQIVEHLLLSYRQTNLIVEERIRMGRATEASPSLRQRLAQWAIISRERFPQGRKAPEAVTPSRLTSLQSGQELAERLTVELRTMDGLLTRAEELFGAARAASHPVLGPLSVVQWRRFHLVHGRHHLRQIASIRQEHGFKPVRK